MEDVVVENCTGNGIDLLGPPDAPDYDGPAKNVTEIRIERSFVQFVGGHGLYVGNPAISRKNQVTDGHVVETVFRRTGGDGIRIEHAGGWVLRGNHLYVNHGNAINVLVLNGRETGIRLGALKRGKLSATVTGNIVTGAQRPLDVSGRRARVETSANILD